jgi:hypothetical protein
VALYAFRNSRLKEADMSRIITNQDNLSSENLTKWDNAIAEAKKGIKRLVLAIQGFEEKKAAGTPWPGTQADSQTSKSCHSV